MANWDSKTVAEVISKLSDNHFVLPVIQRRLIWDEEKMELLFDTLLKANSFGGIMVIEEEANSKPLFAFRHFTKDGTPVDSVSVGTIAHEQFFVIDGQQRLQSFYIGLMGSINGKILYFDLLSDYKSLEYDFRFVKDPSELPQQNSDREDGAQSVRKWYPVTALFMKLKQTDDEDQVASELVKALGVENNDIVETITKNVRVFYKNIFGVKNIGLSRVSINKSFEVSANRQRIVELFRRLNDGGTKLSSFELVASILKGFEWKMEKFLDDILREYQDIGMTQDILIKLLFILRDNHTKEMADIDSKDAQFAVDNKERVAGSLKALRNFLIASRLINYYKEANRSFVPLYFIIYHLFYVPSSTDDLEKSFQTFDTNDDNFKRISRWIHYSLLSGVFSRGVGWIPYKTGVRKILQVMKNQKGKSFPIDLLFDVYEKHPVGFYRTIDNSNIDLLDDSLLFYLLYDCDEQMRVNDRDHIHPYSLLSAQGSEWEKINNIGNFQLLDVGTNRGEKSNVPLDQWIEEKVENYDRFLEERRNLIIGKVNSMLQV